MKSEDICFLAEKLMTNLDSVLKSRDVTLPTYSQVCGLPSGHEQLWELDRKEGRALKNWCLRTVLSEKTLESPLDSKEIKLVNLKGNQLWILVGRTGAEAETPIFCSSDANSWLSGKVPDAGKDWGQKKRASEDEWLDGILMQWTWTWANLGRLPTFRRYREACYAAVHGVAKSWTWLGDWRTTSNDLKPLLSISSGHSVNWGPLLVQFSCSVMSDSLRPHEPQHARPPCPSPTPGVYSNSSSSSRWCHPAISSTVVPFSSCPQSLPESGSFPMSQLFARGGQSIGVSVSASVLPSNAQDWFPLGWTGWISLQSKGLSRVLQHHSSKASVGNLKEIHTLEAFPFPTGKYLLLYFCPLNALEEKKKGRNKPKRDGDRLVPFQCGSWSTDSEKGHHRHFVLPRIVMLGIFNFKQWKANDQGQNQREHNDFNNLGVIFPVFSPLCLYGSSNKVGWKSSSLVHRREHSVLCTTGWAALCKTKSTAWSQPPRRQAPRRQPTAPAFE